MLHAGEAAAVADRLIERIAGRGRAEALAIAAAEALDAVLVEQRFGGGQQGEAVDPAGGALVGGIEGADALDLVAEEIEAQRLLLARWEQIDQAAAHREFAGIGDGLGADIAIGLEQRGEPVAADPLAGRERARRAGGCGTASACAGVAALAVVTSSCGALGRLLEPVERRQPLGHDAQRRRGAVIGQAVPGREAE